MDSLFVYFNSTPVRIALFGAYNVIFAFIAYVSVVRLAVFRRLDRERMLLLLALAVCVGAEWFQLAMQFSKKSFSDYPTWGIPRYFGVIAPLFWIFAAKLLADLLAWRKGRIIVGLSLAAGFGWFAFQAYFCELPAMYREGARADVMAAAKRAAKVIKADYRGPARQEQLKFSVNEYYSTRRPVVFSNFAAVAWLLRGQSEGAEAASGWCPYPDDYLFIRVGSGYGRIGKVDPEKYDFVGSIEGIGTEWRLFRRKTTENNGIKLRKEEP